MALPVKDTMELVQQAMDVVKSRYLLCILISQRIHQLEKGATPAIDVDPDDYISLKQPKASLLKGRPPLAVRKLL